MSQVGVVEGDIACSHIDVNPFGEREPIDDPPRFVDEPDRVPVADVEGDVVH